MKTPEKLVLATLATAAFSLTASAAVPGSVLDPDCVIYYDFETANVRSDGAVLNAADQSSFVLGGGGDWRNGSYPVEASPAEKIRQSLAAAECEDSGQALWTTWSSNDSAIRRYRYFQLTENWFSTTNFTVEFFYKMDGDIAAWTPLFRRAGGGDVQVDICVGGTANKLSAAVRTDNGAGSFANCRVNDDALTNDGEWHHAALVVSQIGETKTMQFYRDYKLKGGLQTLPANVTAKDLGESVILAGRSDQQRVNGCWMDSVRVTLRALEPQEFLTTRPYVSGSTIAHIPFDGGTANASSDYGTLRTGTYRGDITPTYSDDVPGARILDGEDGELLTMNNAQSISFPDATNHSWVSYGSIDGNGLDAYHLHTSTGGQYHTSGTIEFWMKSSQTDADNDTTIIQCYARGKSDSVDVDYVPYMPIQIRFDAGHHLEFGFATSAEGWKAVTASSVDVLDGKWHHIAFTFKPDPTDSSKMVAKGYVDYEAVAMNTFGGHLRLETIGYFDLRLAGQHGINYSNKNYGGLIDELRISDKALEPEEFLHVGTVPGFVIILK